MARKRRLTPSAGAPSCTNEQRGDSQANVVLVGHGGLYRCMLPLVLENADFGFADEIPMSYTEYVVAEARGEGLVWVEWGDQIRA